MYKGSRKNMCHTAGAQQRIIHLALSPEESHREHGGYKREACGWGGLDGWHAFGVN